MSNYIKRFKEGQRVNSRNFWRDDPSGATERLIFALMWVPSILLILILPREIGIRYYWHICIVVTGPMIIYYLWRKKPHRHIIPDSIYNICAKKPHKQSAISQFIKRNLSSFFRLFHIPFLEPIGIYFNEKEAPVEIYDYDYHVDDDELRDTVYFQRGCTATKDLPSTERLVSNRGQLSQIREMQVGKEVILEFRDRTYRYFTIESISEYAFDKIPPVDIEYAGNMRLIIINYPPSRTTTSLWDSVTISEMDYMGDIPIIADNSVTEDVPSSCVVAVCTDTDGLNALNI